MMILQVYACILGCLEPVLTIVSLLSHRNPFVMSLDDAKAADKAKMQFANGIPSDHKALLEAYNGWYAAERAGNGRAFAKQNFLSGPTLKMVEQMRGQFRELLVDGGVVSNSRESMQTANRHGSHWPVVAASLAAGLYPNIARVDELRSASFKKKLF